MTDNLPDSPLADLLHVAREENGPAILMNSEQVRALVLEVIESRRRTHEALAEALQCGTTDGAHHKMWVIDQIVRTLAGSEYEKLIDSNWDEGIPP